MDCTKKGTEGYHETIHFTDGMNSRHFRERIAAGALACREMTRFLTIDRCLRNDAMAHLWQLLKNYASPYLW